MESRYLQEGDYENILTSWWQDHNWDAPAKDSLPDNGTGGVMISKDGVDICAGFLYKTNSSMAWCEYIISNKNYRDSDRGEAIELLINVISKLAKDEGFKFVFTCLKHPVLEQRYKRCGFLIDPTPSKEMIKIL